MSMEKRKDRVPDTAHNCPILRIGVVHNQPASEEKICGKGSFSISSTVCFCTTKPLSSRSKFGIAWRRKLISRVWLSGGEMTGKFRKVASHSAPEPAFGLFLNLPEGSAPWNPGKGFHPLQS